MLISPAGGIGIFFTTLVFLSLKLTHWKGCTISMLVFRHNVFFNRSRTLEVSCALNQSLKYLQLNCRFSLASRKDLELSQIFWPQVLSVLFWYRQRRECESSRFLPGSCQIYILTRNVQDQSAHWFVDEIPRPSRCSRHFNANPSSHIILCFPNETSLVWFSLSFS